MKYISGQASRPSFIFSFLFLFAALLALYASSFGNAWTFDDFPVIVNNPDITSLSAFFQDSYPGRPLRELTYLLDHTLFGLEPTGWHLQSIFWHALNATLLLTLIRRLGGQPTIAWGATLLFLVHPLQVEVVANLSHRKDALALSFILLALLAYQQFAADRYIYAPSAGACILVVWLIDQWLNPRAQRRSAVPTALFAILITLASLTWQQNKIWHTPLSLWSHAIKAVQHRPLL